MKKIIIKFDNDISEYEALKYTWSVVAKGRIGIGAKEKKHYRWLTVFEDGINVSVSPKYNTETDIFTIYRRTE